MSSLAIMARSSRAYEMPAAGQAPRIAVCRVTSRDFKGFVDMRKCKFCRQINHQYSRLGIQPTNCGRAVINVTWVGPIISEVKIRWT